MIKKQQKKKTKAPIFNFSALHLIHDPQGFAEQLFRTLERTNERFEVKLMTLDVVSRLIGLHQLFIFNFYPYLQRFLQPHQRGLFQATIEQKKSEIFDFVFRGDSSVAIYCPGVPRTCASRHHPTCFENTGE